MTVDILTPSSREQWLELRRSTVGASEVACLLGAHPYLSAYKLWLTKTGATADVEESAPMRRGRMLEPFAAERYLPDERPTWRITPNPIPGGRHWRDPVDGMSCTPDAIAVDPERAGFGVVQIKSVAPAVFSKQWKIDGGVVEPPIHVAIQAIQEAVLTGASWAAVAPLVIGWGIDMPIIEIPLHEGVIERIRSEVRAFWDRVRRNDPPESEYAKDGEAIAKVWAGGAPVIDLSSDNELPEIAAEDSMLKDRMAADKKRRDAIKAEILHKLGGAAGATFQGGRIIAKVVHRKAYLVDATSYNQITIKLDRIAADAA